MHNSEGNIIDTILQENIGFKSKFTQLMQNQYNLLLDLQNRKPNLMAFLQSNSKQILRILIEYITVVSPDP